MSIDLSKIQGGPLTNTTTSKPVGGDKAKGSSGPSTGAVGDDRVSLTSTGNVLGTLEQRVGSSDGIDRAKVEAIKEALKRGDYPFNPERIAENILNMERWLAS